MATKRLLGILKDANGIPLANTTIRFSSTSTRSVLNTVNTDYLTNSEGAYDFSVEYGVYTIQIKREDEINFRTVCANAYVYSEVTETLELLIKAQKHIQEIDETIIQEMLAILASANAVALSASNSANIATTKAAEARDSAIAAETSADNSAASADTSEEYSVVAGQKAIEAKGYSEASAASAASSSVFANNSSESAQSAAVSKTLAEEQATIATTKASAAALSEQNALASKQSAELSANTATAKAAEAEAARDTATAASASAITAKDAAETAGLDAARFASTAETNATESASSAASAEVSKTISDNRATDANNYASAAQGYKDTAVLKATEAAQSAREAAQSSALAAGALIEAGSADLSSGVYPIPIKDAQGNNRSCFWKVTVRGSIDGEVYGVGDSLVYSKELAGYYKIDNTESVTSVNGKQGVVVLNKADVNLGNVDNTSDLNKPISTATQNALDVKYGPTNKPTPAAIGAVEAVNIGNWAQSPAKNNVIGYIGWAGYGNGHVIFDASSGKSPNNTDIDKVTAMIPVTGSVSFPTLMGWNGVETFGVRVDYARAAGSAGFATSANILDGGIIKTKGQDLTIWDKRAMVGDNSGNQLNINYANDWGSTLISGPLNTHDITSNRHVIIKNGSTSYADAGLEVRTTDNSVPRIGLHTSGKEAAGIRFKDGYIVFEGTTYDSRVNVAAGNFFADAEQSLSNNALTRFDYVGANFLKYRTRLHSDDGASLDYVNREYGFNYGTGGGVVGPYISFGGLGTGYDCQINANYGDGNEIRFRTHNGDTNVFNPWHSIWHDGNFNPASKLSENGTYGGTLKLGNWFRSTGNTGWYNETYAGGIYMDEASTVKVYGGKSFGVENSINAKHNVLVDCSSWEGNSFNAYRYVNAPLNVDFQGLNVGSFSPIVGSSNYTNGSGYNTKVHLGVLTPSGAGWTSAALMVGSAENDAHPLATYIFGADGHLSGFSKLTLGGNANIGNDMTCSYAYANGAQQLVANALTRKDYVDAQDSAWRWENKQVIAHTNGDANAHYNSTWDGAGVANAPSAEWHFFRELYHSGGANWRHQEAFNFYRDEEWFRRGAGDAGLYGPWRRRWHSGNANVNVYSGAIVSGGVRVTEAGTYLVVVKDPSNAALYSTIIYWDNELSYGPTIPAASIVSVYISADGYIKVSASQSTQIVRVNKLF